MNEDRNTMEVLVGPTLGYDPNRPGFFLFDADPVNNNVRLFAMSTSVREVRFLSFSFSIFLATI